MPKTTTILLLTGTILAVGVAGLLAHSNNESSPKGWSEGPPHGPAMHPPGSPHTPPLSEQEEAKVLEFLEHNRPAMGPPLLRMRQHHPQRYRRVMHSMHGFVERWHKLPEKARQASLAERDARFRVLRKIRKYRRMQEPTEREAARNDIHQAVVEHFEAEQTFRELQLKHLEKRVRGLKKELEDRAQQRQQIIEQRLSDWLEKTNTKPLEAPSDPSEASDVEQP